MFPLTATYLADSLYIIIGGDNFRGQVGHGGGLSITFEDSTFSFELLTTPPGPFGGATGFTLVNKVGSWLVTDSTVTLTATDTLLFRTLTLHRQGERLSARFISWDQHDPANNYELLMRLAPEQPTAATPQ